MLASNKILTLVLLVAILLTTASCEKEVDVPVINTADKSSEAIKGKVTSNYTTYTIRKGQHSSNNSAYKSFSGSSLMFEAIFDKSAIYETRLASNQADINKLYGMADCGSLHQTNSARFGWRWYDGSLQILAYVYSNGVRYFKLIGSIAIDRAYQYQIRVEGNSYVFSVSGLDEVIMPRACSGAIKGYKLYPYFGGDETAPHNITIKIRDM